MRFMPSHGLSSSTVKSIVEQLLAERLGKDRWERVFLMDMLQFDLFSSVYRTLKPHFSTFFLNSTAHLQHMYWRNMEPELFKVKPAPADQEKFKLAILSGYREMDRLVGRVLRLVGDDAVVIFCTAL